MNIKQTTQAFLIVFLYLICTLGYSQDKPIVYYKKGDVTHQNSTPVQTGDQIHTSIKLNSNSIVLLTLKNKINQINTPGNYSCEAIIDLLYQEENISKEYLKYLRSEMFADNDNESSQNILGAVSRASHAQNIFPPDSTQLIYNSVFFIWNSTGVDYYTFYLFDAEENSLTSYLTTDTTFYLSNVSYELTPGRYFWCAGELDMTVDNLPKSNFQVLAQKDSESFKRSILEYQQGLWGMENGEELELFFYAIHKLSMQRYWYFNQDDNLSNKELIQKIISF